MPRLTPDYLLYQDASSDKWYVTVRIDATRGLTGYGPNSPGAAGTWKQVTAEKADTQKKEKVRKGYRGVGYQSLPAPALASLLREVGTMLGQPAHHVAQGQIQVGSDTPAAQPSQAPRRRRTKHNVWI